MENRFIGEAIIGEAIIGEAIIGEANIDNTIISNNTLNVEDQTSATDPFDLNSWDIFARYVSIMNSYLKYFTRSHKTYSSANKENMYIYTLLKGVSTLTHVFHTVLLYTAKVELAMDETHKSIYLYTQFIEQLDENIMQDLSISSTSASTFVYNKTLDSLKIDNGENKITNNPIKISNMQIMKNFELLTTIYRSIINSLFIDYKNNIPLVIDKLLNISRYLCSIDYVNTNEEFYRCELENILLFINHFYMRRDHPLLFDYIIIFIKRFKHVYFTSALMLTKINQYNNMPSDTVTAWSVNKYLKWITTPC
jgi:hypothetical protein